MDIRILVVDDDQDSVDLVEKILKKDGYRVLTLTDGRKVEEEIRKNDIHLAVVDLKMPEVSGLGGRGEGVGDRVEAGFQVGDVGLGCVPALQQLIALALGGALLTLGGLALLPGATRRSRPFGQS